MEEDRGGEARNEKKGGGKVGYSEVEEDWGGDARNEKEGGGKGGKVG